MAPQTQPVSQINFIHHQHAHCESGVTSNLLQHEGIQLSEPLAFGIGAGMFFAHLPFVKVNGTPGTTFRTWPGAIFKRVTERLGVTIHKEKFSDPGKAMRALDAALDLQKPVGMLSSVYYLPYLPDAFRFHFNAHNLVSYGKESGQYLISDPVMEHTTHIAPEDLAKARFAKGTPEPNGMMYFIKETPKQIDFSKAIQKGIKQTNFFMLSPPLPWFGNKAIFLLAKKIKNYPQKYTQRKSALYLGNIIRMQEEIGTGGAGFRYLHAAFLEEAGTLLKRDDLREKSLQLTAIGDQWRNFAYNAARQMKARNSDVVSFDELSNQLTEIGNQEKTFFKQMELLKW